MNQIDYKPKVSVLMPVYNAANYLKETIDSILSQSFEDFEFIILDDCSTDNGIDIINSYSDKRIKLYKNSKNSGISYSRNKLMELAQGEYWAITDNDDISLPERFKKQVEYLDKNKEVGVVSCWNEYFPEYKLIDSKERYKFFDLLRFHPHISHPSSMLRGEIFRKYNIKYYDEYRYAEDYDVWFQVIHHAEIAIIQEVLFKYRWHESNASVKYSEVQLEHTKDIKNKNLNFLTSDKVLQEKIMQLIFSEQNNENAKVYLGGFIPLPFSHIKVKGNKTLIKLFNFLTLIKIKG